MIVRNRNWDDFTQSCGIDSVWETDMLTIIVTGRDTEITKR